MFLVETSENGTTETPNGTTEDEEAKSENVSSTGTENTKENEPAKEDEKKKEDQANKKVKLEKKNLTTNFQQFKIIGHLPKGFDLLRIVLKRSIFTLFSGRVSGINSS